MPIIKLRKPVYEMSRQYESERATRQEKRECLQIVKEVFLSDAQVLGASVVRGLLDTNVLKYVRLGSRNDSFLTIGGEAHESYERFRNDNWGLSPPENNGYLLH
jgi:hypothetical protein